MIWRCERQAPARHGGRGQEAGFTLIEVIVVLAVLAFAMALIVGYKPPWSSGLGLRGTAGFCHRRYSLQPRRQLDGRPHIAGRWTAEDGGRCRLAQRSRERRRCSVKPCCRSNRRIPAEKDAPLVSPCSRSSSRRRSPVWPWSDCFRPARAASLRSMAPRGSTKRSSERNPILPLSAGAAP